MRRTDAACVQTNKYAQTIARHAETERNPTTVKRDSAAPMSRDLKYSIT
jgi:hypothetical protein